MRQPLSCATCLGTATAAVAVVVAAWIALVATCGSPPNHVRFVLPHGFRGLVLLVEEPTAPAIPFVAGRYVVNVPPDGVVRVLSARPVLRYELDDDSWTFRDGTVLPYADDSEASHLPPDSLRAFGGGSMARNDGPNLFFDVVAEAKDADRVRAQVDAAYDRVFPRRR